MGNSKSVNGKADHDNDSPGNKKKKSNPSQSAHAKKDGESSDVMSDLTAANKENLGGDANNSKHKKQDKKAANKSNKYLNTKKESAANSSSVPSSEDQVNDPRPSTSEDIDSRVKPADLNSNKHDNANKIESEYSNINEYMSSGESTQTQKPKSVETSAELSRKHNDERKFESLYESTLDMDFLDSKPAASHQQQSQSSHQQSLDAQLAAKEEETTPSSAFQHNDHDMGVKQSEPCVFSDSDTANLYAQVNTIKNMVASTTSIDAKASSNAAKKPNNAIGKIFTKLTKSAAESKSIKQQNPPNARAVPAVQIDLPPKSFDPDQEFIEQKRNYTDNVEDHETRVKDALNVTKYE